MFQFMDRIRTIPGVTAVAAGTPLPLTGNEMSIAFNNTDRPLPVSGRPRANVAIVTPGYFRTIGVALVRGRDFTEWDTEDTPFVVIVNRAFADHFFPGVDAVGKHIQPGATTPFRGSGCA